jgi:hypothetical protein
MLACLMEGPSSSPPYSSMSVLPNQAATKSTHERDGFVSLAWKHTIFVILLKPIAWGIPVCDNLCVTWTYSIPLQSQIQQPKNSQSDSS